MTEQFTYKGWVVKILKIERHRSLIVFNGEEIWVSNKDLHNVKYERTRNYLIRAIILLVTIILLVKMFL